jgi:hypothetical protein
LQQHIGAAAKPAVQRGDHVLKGQLLANSQGMISAPYPCPHFRARGWGRALPRASCFRPVGTHHHLAT